MSGQERKTGKRVLNVGLLAHVDAGKTTLSESILYQSGAIRNLGRVDHQDAFLDTDEMERERGITIFSKQAVLTWKDTEITLLDTPGHVDFSAEMERVLQVLDCAVLVISGADGDETGGQFDHGRRFFVYIECGRRNVVVSFAGQSSDRAHHCYLGHPGTDLGRLAQFFVHLSVKKSPLFGGQIKKQCCSKASRASLC